MFSTNCLILQQRYSQIQKIYKMPPKGLVPPEAVRPSPPVITPLQSWPLTCGVPQGSVLGPCCSSSKLLHLVHSSKHPQLTTIYSFYTLTPNYSSISLQADSTDNIDHLLHVVNRICSWMTSNLLCLNSLKLNSYYRPSREIQEISGPVYFPQS